MAVISDVHLGAYGCHADELIAYLNSIQPNKEIHSTKKGRCTYLDSGDWVDNLTALEYSLKRWKIYRCDQDKLSPFFANEKLKEMDIHELIASIANKKHQKERGHQSTNAFLRIDMG